MHKNPWDKSVVEGKVVIYTPIVVYTLSRLERLDNHDVSEALREYAVQQHTHLVEETDYNARALAAQEDGEARVKHFKESQWYRLRDISAMRKKGFKAWEAEALEKCADQAVLQEQQSKQRKKKRGGKDLAPPLEMPKAKPPKPMNEPNMGGESKTAASGAGGEAKTDVNTESAGVRRQPLGEGGGSAYVMSPRVDTRVAVRRRKLATWQPQLRRTLTLPPLLDGS